MFDEEESATEFFDDFPPLQIIMFGISLVIVQFFLWGTFASFIGNIFVVNLLASAGALIVFPALLLARHPQPWRETLRLTPIAPGQWIWLVLLAVALLPPVDLLGELNVRMIPVPESHLEALSELTPRGLMGWVLAVVSLCLITPIGEELVFRGLVQQAARRGLPPIVAIGLCGLLFAVIHFQPWYIVPLALVGVALGLVFEATGSLVAPMALHAMYNAAILIRLNSNESLSDASEAPIEIEQVPLTPGDAFLAAACLVVIWLAYRRLRPAEPWPTTVADESWS